MFIIGRVTKGEDVGYLGQCKGHPYFTCNMACPSFIYILWSCFSSWNYVHHWEGYTRGGCRRVTLWFGLATNIRTLKQTHHNQAEILGHLIPNLLVWWLYLICWIKSTMMNSSSKAYRLFGCASIAIKQKQMVSMYAWKHWDVVFVLFFTCSIFLLPLYLPCKWFTPRQERNWDTKDTQGLLGHKAFSVDTSVHRLFWGLSLRQCGQSFAQCTCTFGILKTHDSLRYKETIHLCGSLTKDIL